MEIIFSINLIQVYTFFTFLGQNFLIKGIAIDDLQEIGKSTVVKQRFTMCCRIGKIAYSYISNLVGNGSELQVVLLIPDDVIDK